MTIVKYATGLINSNNYTPPSPNSDFKDALLSSVAASDLEIRERFVKFANNLRRVAPKAKDFLYFTAIMLHSANAALIDQNTGEIKKDSSGKPITAEWKIDDKSGSWKWNCSDSNIKPYKNNNGDIFPESELKKAYRNWIGRPLCKDHQSSSVDGIRGIIVDTYYDDKFKRVIALCALDKVNYPDLARKVATGYANSVSMGTAVGKSICYECGNVAQVEADYCPCVQKRACYGEINVDLSPIELSLVVTGADPLAKLRTVIAHLNSYSQEKGDRIEELKKAGCVTPGELERIENEIITLKASLENVVKKQAFNSEEVETLSRLRALIEKEDELKNKEILEKQYNELLSEITDKKDEVEVVPPYGLAGNLAMTGGRGDIAQDPHSAGPNLNWVPEGRGNRLATDISEQILKITNKLDTMQTALHDLANGIQKNANINKEESIMSDAKLQQRAKARRELFKAAYHQGGGGVNEPSTTPYPVDPINDQLKTKGDKQMEGQGMEPGNDGLHPGYESFGRSELELKKMLSRAELNERKMRRHALLSQAEGGKTYKDMQGNTYIDTDDGVKKVTESNASDELPEEYKELLGLASSSVKNAYHLGGGGINDPSATPYPVDPTNNNLKTNGDKQMEGQGMEPGNDGMHPGYQSYGNEEALKKKLLRANLKAVFKLAFHDADQKVINKKASKWVVLANDQKILEATGEQIFEDELEKRWNNLYSREYGKNLLAAVRSKGLNKVAYLLTGQPLFKTAEPGMPDVGMPEMGGGAPGGDSLPTPPPAEDEGPSADELEEGASNPVDSVISSLDSHLADAEKALGDLKDLMQEETGEGEGELPSPMAAKDKDEDDKDDEEKEEKDEKLCEKCKKAQCACDGTAPATAMEANDGNTLEQAVEVFADLERSADELAVLAETLEGRKNSSKGDIVTAQLLQLSSEAIKDYRSLQKKASLVLEAAGKKKDEEEDDKKEDKKKDKKKKEDKDEKEEKESKKKDKKATDMLEQLLQSRALKRRELVKEAMGEDMLSLEDDLDSDLGDSDLGDSDLGDSDLGDSEDFEAELDKLMSEVRELSGDVDSLEADVDGIKEMEEKEPWHGDLQVEEEANDMSLDQELAAMLADDGDEEDKEEDEEDESDANDSLVSSASKRRAWREKVAAEYQLKLNPQTTADTDMPLAQSANLGQLSTSPSDDGAKVEGLVEMHEKFLREINSLPQVREAVEKITSLIKSGKLNIADLDNSEKLKALAVDPAAAKYYKDYFGQADPKSSEFANELVKEFGKKKVEASLDEQRLKMRRAYDVAIDMQEKGMIPDTVSSLHQQVDELINFNDSQFESFKKAVQLAGRPTKVATASLKVPAMEVGINEDGVANNTTTAPVNLAGQLKSLW